MSDDRKLPIMGVTPARVAARFGLKGTDAPAWLVARGIPLPDAPNRISRWPGGRCLRQGHGEFLVEVDDPDSRDPLAEETARGGAQNVWILLRSDHSLLLVGEHWPDSLAQACSFDLRQLQGSPGLIVMTLLAGIAVTLAAENGNSGRPPALRLWCDASYATYLDHCLQLLAASSLPEKNR